MSALLLDQAKAEGVSQPERVRIMDAERVSEPWTNSNAR